MYLELLDSKGIVVICKVIGGAFAAGSGVGGITHLLKKKTD